MKMISSIQNSQLYKGRQIENQTNDRPHLIPEITKALLQALDHRSYNSFVEMRTRLVVVDPRSGHLVCSLLDEDAHGFLLRVSTSGVQEFAFHFNDDRELSTER
jgi:hypothetical protein